MNRIFFLCLALFFTWSCAQSRQAQTSPSLDKKPNWLEGKSIKYPSAFYITGVGSGYTRQTAENNARANIGKVFQVDITSKTRTVKTETIKNLTDSQLEETTKDEIDASLTKTLQGTEVQDIWQDPDTKKYFAFAVLERDLAQKILSDRLADIDKNFEIQRKITKESGSRIEVIRAYVKCKSLLQTRQVVNSDLRVVSTDNSGLQAPYNTSQEMADIQNFLYNDVKLGMQATTNTPKETAKQFIELITKKGFVVRAMNQAESNAFDIIFNLNLSLNTPREKVDDWYYTSWELSVKALNATNADILSTEVKEGRSGQLSISRAEQKARYDAGKKLPALTQAVLSDVFGD